MSMKMNKAEFMFGEKACELQIKLEEETGVRWTIERTCTMISNGENDIAATLSCSVCGNTESVYAICADEFNYCPNCGAKVVSE